MTCSVTLQFDDTVRSIKLNAQITNLFRSYDTEHGERNEGGRSRVSDGV